MTQDFSLLIKRVLAGVALDRDRDLAYKPSMKAFAIFMHLHFHEIFGGQSKVPPLHSSLKRCTRKTSAIISLYCVPPPIELVGGAFTKRAAHTLQLLSVNISPSLPQPPAFLPRLSNTLALVLEFHPSNSSSSRSRLWWLSNHNGAKTFMKGVIQKLQCVS